MPILANSKYELFAQKLAQGMSASAAYVAAGYEAHGSNAGRLSKNEQVRARVQELQSEGARQAGVTVEGVVRELAKIGFSDIRKVVRWSSNLTEVGESADTGEPMLRAFNNVALIDSDALDDAMAGAIAEVSQTKEGALKIKLYDKRAALVDLGKHLGMFDEQDVNANITVNISSGDAEL